MVNDEFGIVLKYPSSDSNQQYVSFPIRFSTLNQTQVLQNKVANIAGSFAVNSFNDIILWYEFAPSSGNDSKFLILPSSMSITDGRVSLDVDCELDHQQTSSQGYVNNPAEWQDVEMTSHLFVKTVDSIAGYVFLEARNGYDGDEGGCCQGTAYGVRLYWDNGADKGKFAFYKKEFTGSVNVLAKQSQSKLSTFYQEWFGVKFVIYNTTANRVKLELWLTPATFANPSHATSNSWTKVGEIEDFAGKNWTSGGDECNASTDDAPITWATPFVAMGWQDGKVIQFNFTSFREIDPNGSFGEDPPPPENQPPFPDPTLPDPDPEPPTVPGEQPPDATPPAMPQTLTKRLTIRREVVNSITCSCDGIQPPPVEPPPGGDPGGGTDPPGGGDPGGGGGSGTLTQIYNVPVNQTGFGRLAKVANSTSYYLRYGQACTRTSSTWIGKSINRVEITIGKVGNPTGGTGGGVHCRIRTGITGGNDAVVATLTPVASETQITAAGTVLVFENLTNTYKMVLNDKLMFEYDGGDINNYIKIFRVTESSQSGTKILFQDNSQEAGEYGDIPDLDMCARIWTLTP